MPERLDAVGCDLDSAALETIDKGCQGHFALWVNRSAEASIGANAVKSRLRKPSKNGSHPVTSFFG